MKTLLISFENKHFFSVLLAFSFALPFNNLTSVNSILMGLLFILWTVRNFTTKKQLLFRTPLDLPLMGYFTWVGLSLLWTVDFHESFNGFIALGKQIFLFYLIATTVETKDQFFKILLAFLFAILIIDISAIFNFFASGGSLFHRYVRAGTMGSADPTILNVFMVIFLPLSIVLGLFSSSIKLKIPLYILSVIFIFTLYISYERAGWMAFGFQILIFLTLYNLYNKKLLYKVGGGIFCLILVLYLLFPITTNDHLQGKDAKNNIHQSDITNLSNLNLRIKVWKFGSDKLFIHPFLGNGYGKEIFSKVFQGNEILIQTPHLHNTFLEILFELGIPGLILFLSCFLKIFFHSYRILVSSNENYLQVYALFIFIMTGGVIFKNLFDHMFIGCIAEIFWILTALLFVPSLKEKEST